MCTRARVCAVGEEEGVRFKDNTYYCSSVTRNELSLAHQNECGTNCTEDHSDVRHGQSVDVLGAAEQQIPGTQTEQGSSQTVCVTAI